MGNGKISTLIKNRVGDDGVPAILQYRPSDLYLTDRKETMTILPKMYPHTSPHLQIRPSLVHPFLSQDKLVIQMLLMLRATHGHLASKNENKQQQNILTVFQEMTAGTADKVALYW